MLRVPLPSNISNIGCGEIKFFLSHKEPFIFCLISSFKNCVFYIFHVTKITRCFTVLGEKSYPAHLLINLEFYSQMVIVPHFYETKHHCQKIHICSSANIVLQLKHILALPVHFSLSGIKR